MKVLVLCHGNIYRSPFAAAVISQTASSSMKVRSRGFVNLGRVAAKKMRLAAAKRGYDLSDHRSKTVIIRDVLWADVCLYMDKGNYRRLHILFNKSLNKVIIHPLGWYLNPPMGEIKDPAFMKADSIAFQLVVSQLEGAALTFASYGPCILPKSILI